VAFRRESFPRGFGEAVLHAGARPLS
jgi:hypothetical protein